MAHWFGLKPWDLEALSYNELECYLSALGKLPPVGAVFLVSPKE